MSSLVEFLLYFALMYPIFFIVVFILDVFGAWVVLRNCITFSHKYRRRPGSTSTETPGYTEYNARPPLIDLAEVESVKRGNVRHRKLVKGDVYKKIDPVCICEEINVARRICMCRNLRGTVSSIL